MGWTTLNEEEKGYFFFSFFSFFFYLSIDIEQTTDRCSNVGSAAKEKKSKEKGSLEESNELLLNEWLDYG